MFGSKKKGNQEPSFLYNVENPIIPKDSKREFEEENEPENILSSDAEIKGTIKFNGIMRIDGYVNGEISTDNGELVVSESGIVNATITTKSAVIEGRVDGKITASDKVVLKQKALVAGDLQTKILVIEEGVVFVGRCNVNSEGVTFDNIVKKDQPKTLRN